MESVLRPVLSFATPYALRLFSAFTSGQGQAMEELKKEGMKIIATYADGKKDPTADKIKQAIFYGLVPAKTLLTGAVITTLGFYLLSKVVSFLPIVPSIAKISWIVTAYLTYEIYSVYFNLARMHRFFGELEDRQISQEELIRHINSYCRDILVAAPLLSTLVEGIGDFNNIGQVVEDLIKNESQDEDKKSPPAEVVMNRIPKLVYALALGQVAKAALSSPALVSSAPDRQESAAEESKNSQ